MRRNYVPRDSALRILAIVLSPIPAADRKHCDAFFFDDHAATLALLSDLDVVAPRAKIGWYIFALALVTAVILGMFWPLLQSWHPPKERLTNTS